MDVKEAVRTAKQYMTNVFANEGLGDLGLEEVVFDDDKKEWRITVGFSRPLPKTTGQQAAEALGLVDTANRSAAEQIGILVSRGEFPPRLYKIVTISDDTGKVRSVRNRELV